MLFQVRDWREAARSVVGQGVHGTTEPEEAKHYRCYTSKNELRGVTDIKPRRLPHQQQIEKNNNRYQALAGEVIR